MARSVLCIGNSAAMSALCEALRAAGWAVHLAANPRSANRLLAEHRFKVGVLLYPDVDEALCAELDSFLGVHARLEWLGCFGAESVLRPKCRDLILTHLFDHHTLPIDSRHVIACIGHAEGRANMRPADRIELPSAEPIVGNSIGLAELLRQTRRVAIAQAPVLIEGESGSGKELIAQLVHLSSARAQRPFVAVNCGAIQATLIQSELFGHERGAFTGAVADKRGIFETADGGTVFLDEIGDLPLELQANLLRFLQEGTINRVGSARSIKLDVRIVAATNVDLDKAVASGAFRQDLFYRLNVLPLHVPPLRKRREDIESLAHHFFRKFAAEKSPRLKGFNQAALTAMEAHSWPGNVRELINRVRYAMVMATGKLIAPADLRLDAPEDAFGQIGLGDARFNAERLAIASSLQQTGRNVAGSARQLGVSRMTLYRLMIKHGIDASQ